MDIVNNLLTWFGNLPIFSDPKWIVGIALMIVYLLWDRIKGKKAYCYIRIKEKQGNTFIDHGKLYKGLIIKQSSETGRNIKWLYIDGIKKVWRLPQNTEFAPSMGKQKILELAWYGKNTFQVLKPDEFMYESNGSGQWIKKRTTEASLRVVPEDMKYMDYELSTTIDELTNNKSWWQSWLDKNGLVVLALFICLLMVAVTVNKTSEVMSETRDSFDSLGALITKTVQDQTLNRVDDNTIKGQDISKIGSTDSGGNNP